MEYEFMEGVLLALDLLSSRFGMIDDQTKGTLSAMENADSRTARVKYGGSKKCRQSRIFQNNT